MKLVLDRPIALHDPYRVDFPCVVQEYRHILPEESKDEVTDKTANARWQRATMTASGALSSEVME